MVIFYLSRCKSFEIFFKNHFFIWNSRFQKSNQGHPSYDAIYKAVIFYYLLNTLFLQSNWPKWPQKMTKSHDESSILTPSAGISKEFTVNITVLYRPRGHSKLFQRGTANNFKFRLERSLDFCTGRNHFSQNETISKISNLTSVWSRPNFTPLFEPWLPNTLIYTFYKHNFKMSRWFVNGAEINQK